MHHHSPGQARRLPRGAGDGGAAPGPAPGPLQSRDLTHEFCRRPEKKKLLRLKRRRTNAVNSRQARIVLLSRGGLANRAIAAQADCTPQWVRIIIHRFNADGLEGITWFPFYQARGTPRKFLADVREQIAEVALSSPKVLIGMNQWSVPRLRGI